MRRIFFLLCVVSGLGWGSGASAIDYEEMSLGSPDAPVTVVDYSSLTCGHCGAFHTETLPRLKRDYIDTGKARLVFVDFPFDAVALTGAKLVRCADAASRWPLLDLIFKTQGTWIRGDSPVDELKRMAGMAGMSGRDVEACLADRDLETALLEQLRKGERAHGIDSTPTFLIDGAKVVGNQPYATFQAAIDRALGD